MESLVCEKPNLKCMKPMKESDIKKAKDLLKDLVPTSMIDSVFKDLEKEYKDLQAKSKSNKSKSNKSKSKSKSNKSKSKGGSSKTRKNMKGGLSSFIKDKITSIVILLVAGASVWYLIPLLETYLVSVGILPKLCGQSMLEHMSASVLAPFGGQTCSDRQTRYSAVSTSLIALITGSVWYRQQYFTKGYLTKDYNKVHRYVKKTLFGPGTTPSPQRTPSPILQAVAQSSVAVKASAPVPVAVKASAPPKATSKKAASPPRQQYSSREEQEYYEQGYDQQGYDQQDDQRRR